MRTDGCRNGVIETYAGGDVEARGLANITAIPEWLTCIIDKLDREKITEKRCNHFLINEYKGPIGIMPHTDGPLYHPYVSILSLGSPILFKFYADIDAYYAEDPNEVLLVENGSLFIFEKLFYDQRLHSINEIGFESFAIPLKLTQNTKTSKWSISMGDSPILNFKFTRLYQKSILPLVETLTDFDSEALALENLMKLLNSKKVETYTFDVTFNKKPGEEKESPVLVVGWARELRVSLTVRYIKPADADAS